jgi:hypothetical protein
VADFETDLRRLMAQEYDEMVPDMISKYGACAHSRKIRSSHHANRILHMALDFFSGTSFKDKMGANRKNLTGMNTPNQPNKKIVRFCKKLEILGRKARIVSVQLKSWKVSTRNRVSLRELVVSLQRAAHWLPS